jgi:hypothetical protein
MEEGYNPVVVMTEKESTLEQAVRHVAEANGSGSAWR